jgi:hypothetical protein
MFEILFFSIYIDILLFIIEAPSVIGGIFKLTDKINNKKEKNK